MNYYEIHKEEIFENGDYNVFVKTDIVEGCSAKLLHNGSCIEEITDKGSTGGTKKLKLKSGDTLSLGSDTGGVFTSGTYLCIEKI